MRRSRGSNTHHCACFSARQGNRITDVLEDDDERTLPYLRKTPAIGNDQARRYATGKLISHKSFDPVKDKALLDRLLADEFVFVRRAALISLGYRTDVDPHVQIATALKLYHSKEGDKPGNDVRWINPNLRFYALRAIFQVLQRMPKEERERILRNPRYKIPRLMISALASKSSLLVVQTTFTLRGEKLNPTPPEEALQRVLAWWSEFIPTEAEGTGKDSSQD